MVTKVKIFLFSVLTILLCFSMVAWAQSHKTDLAAWLSGGTWHNFKIKPNDSFIKIMQQSHINPQDSYKVYHLPMAKKALAKLHIGQSIKVLVRNGHIINLHVPMAQNKLLFIEKQKNNFIENIKTIKNKSYIKNIQFVIQNSLYGSALKNHVPISLIAKVANTFNMTRDFTKSIKQGDTVKITYQVSENFTGIHNKLLDAKYCHKKQCIRMINFNGEFYSPSGKSFSYSFSRSPLAHYRISSSFSRHRWHPILHHWRSHLGVDLAAPSGSKIRATSDGTVIFSGLRGGYGRVVVIKHGKKYRTLYAHMSKIANKSWVGHKVKKGDVIGYVGQTGIATGPHCHYEIRVHGRAVNPMRFKLPTNKSIIASQHKAFIQHKLYLDKFMVK